MTNITKMGNGLSVAEDEFMTFSTKEQMRCLYRNQLETLKAVKGYRFHQKIQYVMISFCIALSLFLAKLHLK